MTLFLSYIFMVLNNILIVAEIVFAGCFITILGFVICDTLFDYPDII